MGDAKFYVQSLYTKIMVHHYHLLGAPQAKNLVHYNHVSLKPSFPLLTRKHNTLLSCNTVIEQNNVFFVLLRKWSNGWPVSSVGKWGRQKPRLRAQKSWDVPTLFENQTKSVNVCFRNIQRLHGPSFERTFPDAPFEKVNENARFPLFRCSVRKKQTTTRVSRFSDVSLKKHTKMCISPFWTQINDENVVQCFTTKHCCVTTSGGPKCKKH